MNARQALERVRKLCLSLPDTEEKLSHGEPTWFVRKRVFVMFANDHHGDGRIAIWCNTSEGLQQDLVTSDPEHFFVPPYVGVRGWIGVRLDRGLDRSVVASIVKDSYDKTRAPRGRAKAMSF
jgi:predicted DNA-binding protein (MmcQ/YjbR family)